MQAATHQPPEPPILDGNDAVAWRQRLNASKPRTARCFVGRTLSTPALSRCKLACYAVGSPKLALLPLVQAATHQPPEPPILDGNAVAWRQRLNANKPRTARCFVGRTLPTPAQGGDARSPALQCIYRYIWTFVKRIEHGNYTLESPLTSDLATIARVLQYTVSLGIGLTCKTEKLPSAKLLSYHSLLRFQNYASCSAAS